MFFKRFAGTFIDNEKNAFTLRWNWGGVLLFVLVWSYGFEGIAFADSPIKSLLVTVLAVCALALINSISVQNKNLYQEEVRLTNLDIAVWLLYVALLVALTVFATYGMDISLVGDQLYHAQTSQNQSMDLADWLIKKLHIPATVEYKIVVRLVGCALLAMLVAFILFMRQYRLQDRTVLMGLLLLLLTLGHHYADIHPPFRLFPLWLSSILFGLNDLAFRLVSLIALSVFAFVIYRFSQKHVDRFQSLLIGLAVSSIPLLLHVGSIVEQSVWTALAWSFLLVSMRESSNTPNYVRWISVVTIASLMRAPAFVGLVPIFMLMGVEYLRSKDYRDIQKYLVYLAPVLVLIPFMWVQLSQGTPATSGKMAPFQQMVSSFENGFSLKAMYYSIPMPWVLFLPFCLLPVRKNWSACLAYIVFFIAAYFVFYSIRPVLWGVPRYQSELWLPFMILGFYNLIILLGQIKSAELPIRIGLVLLIASNAIVITHLDRINRPVDRWTDYYDEVKTGNVRILSEGVYNIDVAMQAVRDGGYAKSACKVGIPPL